MWQCDVCKTYFNGITTKHVTKYYYKKRFISERITCPNCVNKPFKFTMIKKRNN